MGCFNGLSLQKNHIDPNCATLEINTSSQGTRAASKKNEAQKKSMQALLPGRLVASSQPGSFAGGRK